MGLPVRHNHTIDVSPRTVRVISLVLAVVHDRGRSMNPQPVLDDAEVYEKHMLGEEQDTDERD